jgi:hypothetical protein
MSVNVPTWYVRQFNRNLNLLLQQMDSRFAGTVDMGTYVGDQGSPVDQMGIIEAQLVTDRFAPMGRVDAPTDRRWVFPSDYDLPQLFDSFDKLRLLTDPMSKSVQNAYNAMRRARDTQIVGAFFGTSQTGAGGATSTVFPTAVFPAAGGQTVSVSVGGTTSSLNVAKLKQGLRIFLQNEIDLDAEQIYCAISAAENEALLKEIEVINEDYGPLKPVVEKGRVRSFMGIQFINSERLTTGTDDAAGTSRAVPMWTKDGMHLGVWNDIEADISQRKDIRSLPWQAYVKQTIGATRLEEKRVVRVWCR